MPPTPAPDNPFAHPVYRLIFLDTLATGILSPTLPLAISAASQQDPGHTVALIALLSTVTGMLQLLALPLLTWAADMAGARRLLLISIGLSTSANLVLALEGSHLFVLFLARLMGAGLSATMPIASANLIADLNPSARATALSRLGGVAGLGLASGAFLGGWIGQHHLPLAFLTASVAGVLAALTVSSHLRAKVVAAPSRVTQRADGLRRGMGSIRTLVSSHPYAFLSVLLYQITRTVPATVLVIHMTQNMSLDATDAGSVIAMAGLFYVAIQLLGARLLVERLGERRCTCLGLTAGALGFAMYGVVTSLPGLLVSAFLVAATSLFMPSISSLLSNTTDRQGALQGALSIPASVAGLFGPPVFAYLFGYAQHSTLPGLAGLPFFGAAALAMLSLLAYLCSYRLDRSQRIV